MEPELGRQAAGNEGDRTGQSRIEFLAEPTDATDAFGEQNAVDAIGGVRACSPRMWIWPKESSTTPGLRGANLLERGVFAAWDYPGSDWARWCS